MTKPSIGLNDSEILDRLMTRRDIARIGAAGVLVGPTHDHPNLFLAGGGLFPQSARRTQP